jgi:hypothetical protein
MSSPDGSNEKQAMEPLIQLSSRAEAKFGEIPLSLLDDVERRLVDLAEHPSTQSEPTAFPFPPGRLMHHFRLHDFEDTRWDFTVLFRRLADETGIYIDNLVIQTLTSEEREGPSAP